MLAALGAPIVSARLCPELKRRNLLELLVTSGETEVLSGSLVVGSEGVVMIVVVMMVVVLMVVIVVVARAVAMMVLRMTGGCDDGAADDDESDCNGVSGGRGCLGCTAGT